MARDRSQSFKTSPSNANEATKLLSEERILCSCKSRPRVLSMSSRSRTRSGKNFAVKYDAISAISTPSPTKVQEIARKSYFEAFLKIKARIKPLF